MQKLFLIFLIFLYSFPLLSQTESDITKRSNKIQWTSFMEAVEISKKEKKKIFIDVYTNWCGWCKKMDNTTFANSDVIEYINKNFHPVKLNAEMKETIIYGTDTMKFVKFGRSGAHEIAMKLLDGKMGYPSYVVLDENFGMLKRIPGYKTVDKLMAELLSFSNENKHPAEP